MWHRPLLIWRGTRSRWWSSGTRKWTMRVRVWLWGRLWLWLIGRWLRRVGVWSSRFGLVMSLQRLIRLCRIVSNFRLKYSDLRRVKPKFRMDLLIRLMPKLILKNKKETKNLGMAGSSSWPAKGTKLFLRAIRKR